MALTDIGIKRAKAKDKPYKLSDDGNLFLWVTPAGGRIWRWAYRVEGTAKLMTLGKYPDVPLALARTRHAEARKLLAAGIDPMAQRKADKTAGRVANENSFASIAAQRLSHWQDGKSPRHVDATQRRLSPADTSTPPAPVPAWDRDKARSEQRANQAGPAESSPPLDPALPVSEPPANSALPEALASPPACLPV
jgi:hypothetical protein